MHDRTPGAKRRFDIPPEKRTTGALLAAAAERNGGGVFLRWAGQEFTYSEADRLADTYAARFSQLGIGRGDHVAVMLDNRPEFFWITFGLGRLGAVAVTLNTAAKGELLAYYVAQSDSSTLVVAAEFAATVRALAGRVDRVQRVIVVDGDVSSTSALASLGVPMFDLAEVIGTGHAEFEASSPVEPSDPAFIMFTSGTTGPSKGVLSPHSQSVGVGLQVAESFGYTVDDVLFTNLPLFHVNALWYSSYAAIAAASTLVIGSRFSARSFWSEIKESGATQFNFMGTQAAIMLKAEPSPIEREHRVRQAMIVPAHKDVVHEFGQRYGIRAVSVFASSETFQVTVFDESDPLEKAGTAGRAAPGARIRIADAKDNPVPPGQPGEILVAADDPAAMLLGYYKMPDATAEAMRGGWFHSGDRGYLDADGYLFFLDRIKDVIRRRGENISAYEMENTLAHHPIVREVAAVAVPSELGEDDVVVFVVPQHEPDTSVDATAIVHFADLNMAYYMVPRYVHFVDELPKTPNTRVEKYKLREWAIAHRDELWDREQVGIVLKR
ncbi:AMP-binding protein [Herbiconiux sp. P16]|uniref:AMP-binding protein n=1 Tax=Herbiconiux wuyangfengii TaxID=3342794 RepID=UPI0035B7EE9A